MNPALQHMLAFDIETLGLDPSAPVTYLEQGVLRTVPNRVTCACAHNGAGVSRTFLFTGEEAPTEEDLKGREEFLDAAPLLCAFNGVRFDIPFLCRSWNLPASRAGAWVRKTLDPFEASKLALGRTFPLSRLLSTNGLESKTGSGLDAIALAHQREYARLGAYCMQDTRLTFLAASQHAVALPLHSGGRRVVLQGAGPCPFVLW